MDETRKRLLPQWSSFNALGRNRVVRSSFIWAAIVPVAAKMLSAIDKDFVLPIFGPTKGIVLGVPFSWELLYYSSIFFAIATLIYSLCCPEIVRKYDKYSDFEAEGKGGEQLVAYAFGTSGDRVLHEVWKPHWLSSSQYVRFARRYGGCHTYPDEQVQQVLALPADQVRISGGNLSDAFWFVRECADQYSPRARIALGASYAIGFALVTWVLFQNFWFVVSRHLLFRG